jgi:hypothetical protein
MAGGNLSFDAKVKGDILALPVKSAEHIYRGHPVGVEGTGYAVEAGDETGVLYQGHAMEEVDNSSGSDGDKWVRIQRHGIMMVKPSVAAGNVTVKANDVNQPCCIHTQGTSSVSPRYARAVQTKCSNSIGRIIAVHDADGDGTIDSWLVELNAPVLDLGNLFYRRWRGIDIPLQPGTYTTSGTSKLGYPAYDGANPGDGVFRTSTSDNVDFEVQMGSFSARPEDKPFHAKMRCKIISEGTSSGKQSAFYFGLAATDADIWGGVSDHYVLFRKDDGSVALTWDAKNGSADADNAISDDIDDSTWIALGYEWDGSIAKLWVNGVQVGTLNSATIDSKNLPAAGDEVGVSFGLQNGETDENALVVSDLIIVAG